MPLQQVVSSQKRDDPSDKRATFQPTSEIHWSCFSLLRFMAVVFVLHLISTVSESISIDIFSISFLHILSGFLFYQKDIIDSAELLPQKHGNFQVCIL